MTPLLTKMRDKIERHRLNLLRQIYARNLDTIACVKQRNRDFELLRDTIRASGTNSLGFFCNAYTHEGGLRLQQNPDEFAALSVYLQEHRPFSNYIEIGSASGGCCLFLSKQVGFGRIIVIDDGNHPDAGFQAENLSKISNLSKFVGDSHSEETRKFIDGCAIQGALDVAFIDGDHSFAGVWKDISVVLEYSHPGTFIILHDTIACIDVARAWLRCVRKGLLKPVAEYIGDQCPLGIAIGRVT